MAIAQLPPLLRLSVRNIVLAALFVGSGKPNWFEIVPILEQEINQRVVIENPQFGLLHLVSLKVVLVVTELVAKANMLTMFQNNGNHSCNFRTDRSVTIEGNRGYYPYNKSLELRDTAFHESCLNLAETVNAHEMKCSNISGVKGRSAFQNLVADIPLSFNIDYMHCILLGVYHVLLRFVTKLLSKREDENFYICVKNLKAPSEVIDHGRRIRGLDEFGYFKANEILNYMLYVGVVLLRNTLPVKVYHNYLCLVFGNRLLLQPFCENDLAEGKDLIDFSVCKVIW